MSFVMPLLLVGLIGISIPVIIHLLHRQRTQPVLWGAMQFLRISRLQMKRKKRVEQWILMAVRCLALAALALLLARPRWAQSRFVPKGLADAPVDVAVVLDHSLSTGRLSNGQTGFDQGIAVTDKVLDQLKTPGDTISIILAEHKARLLNTQPLKVSDSGAIAQLRQRLREQRQGMTDCSIPEAISAARRLVSSGRNPNKLILIVSDAQRTNWHVHDDALWRAALGDRTRQIATSLSVHSLPIAPDAQTANVSVGQIAIQPTVLGINRPVQINANVANTGSKPLPGLTAKLIVNGKQIDARPVGPLAPKSAATVRFDIDRGFTQAGSSWMKVAVDATDALQADNAAFAAANVLQQIPVLVIDGQFSSAGTFRASRFLQAAVAPIEPSLLRPKVVSVSEAAGARLDDYTVVVVNDVPSLPQTIRDRLADYARAGHGLWIILGPRTQRVLIEKDLPAAGLIRADVREVKDATGAPSGIEVKDANNPMVAIVAANERNALAGAVTRKWWSLRPRDADTQVVVAAQNGDPLVMERPYGNNRGMVCLWATATDGSWNNWNLMPNFVPLVHETIYHLASAQMRGLENRGIEAGQPIEWIGSAQPAVRSVQITLPDNSTVQRPATFNNGRWILTYPDTYLPGIYRLQFSPSEIPTVYYGVNIDRKELDPTPLASDDIDWLKKENYLDPDRPSVAISDLPVIIRRNGEGAELWPWFGAFLLAGLLFETYMTYRMVGSQKPVDVAGAGLVPAHQAA